MSRYMLLLYAEEAEPEEPVRPFLPTDEWVSSAREAGAEIADEAVRDRL